MDTSNTFDRGRTRGRDPGGAAHLQRQPFGLPALPDTLPDADGVLGFPADADADQKWRGDPHGMDRRHLAEW